MSPRPTGTRQGQARESIYQFVVKRIQAGLPPTIREVQEAMGYKSVQSAREHLDNLVTEGRLTKLPGRSRGYGLRAQALQRVGGFLLPDAGLLTWIPILGRVQAGNLTVATQDVEGYVPMPAGRGTQSGRQELFALRVQGDSMIDAGIYHGDIVIVRWQNTASPGDVIVALVGDESTVKTYSMRNGQVRLLPANEAYQPIIPNPEDFSILGKVVELRRFLDDEGISQTMGPADTWI